jgi:superfamily I DNA/RNA helicase
MLNHLLIVVDMHEMRLGSTPRFPSFDEGKFAALCGELKQLYVAITRARQELFIIDEDKEFKVCAVDLVPNNVILLDL